MRFILFLCLVIACSGCEDDKHKLFTDMNGFVLGNDSGPHAPLVIGLGETVDQFLAQNAYLAQMKHPGGNYVLDFPLMTKVDAIYDDGQIKMPIGCSFTTDIRGNANFVGINYIGFQLCEPAVDDWTQATRRATALMNDFVKHNPGLTSLAEMRKTKSRVEAEKIWRTRLYDPFSKTEYPLSEEEANRFFQLKVDGHHFEQLRLRQNTFAMVGGFMNDRVLVFFDISKETYWLSPETEQQKNTMKYLVTITFLQNYRTAQKCQMTDDRQRCVVQR